jgi:hypothetical protein
MRWALRVVAALGWAAAVCAQTAPPAGLETNWDIAPVLREIADHAGRLLPVLDRVDAQGWVAKGASDTYIAQLQSSKEQARGIQAEANELARNPEQLAVTVQLAFRIQALETMLASLGEAVRRYQSQADAQSLAAVVAQGGSSRDRLQHYVVNLAAAREHDLKVMDQEAQRCRGVLTQAPVKTGKKK